MTYGVAKGATLKAVKVLGSGGSGSAGNVIQGIDFVAGNCTLIPKCVASLSLSGGGYTPLDEAVQGAVGNGVSVVVSAGNNQGDACSRSPAREPSAITVGSTDSSDSMSWFSNYGTVSLALAALIAGRLAHE